MENSEFRTLRNSVLLFLYREAHSPILGDSCAYHLWLTVLAASFSPTSQPTSPRKPFHHRVPTSTSSNPCIPQSLPYYSSHGLWSAFTHTHTHPTYMHHARTRQSGLHMRENVGCLSLASPTNITFPQF